MKTTIELRTEFVATINTLYADSDKNAVDMAIALVALKGTFEKAKDFNEYVKNENEHNRLAVSITCAKAYVNVGEFINAYGAKAAVLKYGYTKLGYILPFCKGEKGAWDEANSKAVVKNAKAWSAIPAGRLKGLSRLIRVEGMTLCEAMNYLKNSDLAAVEAKDSELKKTAKAAKEAEAKAAIDEAVKAELEKAGLIDAASLLYELTKALSAVEAGDKEIATAAIKSAMAMLK